MSAHDRPAETARQDVSDLGELLAEATSRTVLDEAPGKSGARLERVVIRGQSYVLKRLDLADDWTMRASGCLRGAPFELWERGILARLPNPDRVLEPEADFSSLRVIGKATKRRKT